MSYYKDVDPEGTARRFREYLDSVNRWYYPIRDVTVNAFRVPKNSRFLWAAKDKFGRPSFAFGVPDALEECETRYFIRKNDWNAKDLESSVSGVKYAGDVSLGVETFHFYEVDSKHYLVARYLTNRLV